MSEVGVADQESGHIYVLRSLSEDPQTAGIENMHKIGFSTKNVEQRIANASMQPTYLRAPVMTLEDYRPYNLKPSALEHLLHRFCAEVRLDITQIDRNGRDDDLQMWFSALQKLINQAIAMIVSGEIGDYVYVPAAQRLIERD